MSSAQKTCDYNPLEHAEDEGFEAFVCGKTRFANPFPSGSAQRGAWHRGWLSARDYTRPDQRA